jgi:hypothetical protein
MLGKFVGNVVARGERISQAILPPGTPTVRLPPWLKLPNLHSFNFILLHCKKETCISPKSIADLFQIYTWLS